MRKSTLAIILMLGVVAEQSSAITTTLEYEDQREAASRVAVSNEIAFLSSRLSIVSNAATNYTDLAIQAAGGVTPEMVTNIVIDVSPAPGNYAAVSNAAMSALSRAEAEAGFTEWKLSGNGLGFVASKPWYAGDGVWILDFNIEGLSIIASAGGDEHSTDLEFKEGGGYGVIIDVAATRTRLPTMADLNGKANTNDVADALAMLQEELENGAIMVNNAFNADEAVRADLAQNSIYAYSLFDEDTDKDRSAKAIYEQLDAGTETNAAQSAAIAAIPAAVTNIVREANGGIWDAALEVWWTPRMMNGSLTYEATTNVNLNAEN